MNRKLIDSKNLILRKKSQKIKEIDSEIRELSQDMSQIMVEKQGVGLAAVQIGELKRIILVQTEDGLKFFVNPEIVEKSKETETAEEGCLSLPGLWLKIKRAKQVEVKFLNLQGQEETIKAQGLLARILQHEIDHLDGKLIIDRISFWQKLRIKKRV
jgi:peptide deformylase